MQRKIATGLLRFAEQLQRKTETANVNSCSASVETLRTLLLLMHSTDQVPFHLSEVYNGVEKAKAFPNAPVLRNNP